MYRIALSKKLLGQRGVVWIMKCPGAIYDIKDNKVAYELESHDDRNVTNKSAPPLKTHFFLCASSSIGTAFSSKASVLVPRPSKVGDPLPWGQKSILS